MKVELFGKTLAECKDYHMTAVKENINGNKYVTLNSEPGNRETAINIYISQRLSDKYDVDEHLPLGAVIQKMTDEETGEEWPLLTSASTYVSIADLLEAANG